MSAISLHGADGSAMPAVQPIPDSISGSPFTVSGTSVATPELNCSGIMVHSTSKIHIKFSTHGSAAVAADVNDMPVPAGQLIVFPVKSGQVLTMIKSTGENDATVHVEKLRTGA